MDRGAWWATVHGVAKELDMTEQLMCTCVCVRAHTHTHTHDDVIGYQGDWSFCGRFSLMSNKDFYMKCQSPGAPCYFQNHG